MDNVVPMFDPTNYLVVQRRIKSLWQKGVVEIRPHAVRQMEERKLDTNDLERLIKYGQIVEHSKPGELWRFVINGTTTDNVRAACVVELNGRLIVVTVMRRR